MKAAVFYGKEDIRVENRDLREPGEGEVVIQIKAAGVCGTDMHIFQGAPGASDCNPPVVLGHEFSGVISRVGNGVTKWKTGDRVTADPSILCNKCVPCLTGRPHFCESYTATGVNFDGAFAEYCVVHEKQLFKLPDNVSFEEGAMCEPLGCCLHGIDIAAIRTGDHVMIIGGGTIGLIMLQLANMAGAGTLSVVEPQTEKRRKAANLGADYTINPIKEDVRTLVKAGKIPDVDVTIECCGSSVTMKNAIDYLGRGGTAVLFGVSSPDCTIELHPFDLFRREITIKSSFVNPYCHGRAAGLLATRKLHLKELVSDLIPLDEIDKAFTNHAPMGKMLIIPSVNIG